MTTENKGVHRTVPKLGLCILSIVVIAGLGVALYVLRSKSYLSGYDEGYEKGYDEGYRKGCDDGECEHESENQTGASYSVGYHKGYADALAAYGLNPDNLANAKEESWPYEILMDAWLEVDQAVTNTPWELYISEDSISLAAGAEDITFGYTLPDNAYTQERIEGEVYITLKDCNRFENLILHEETLEDGTVIPILTATTVELDGRGEVVIAEFAPYEEASRVPAAFRSSVSIGIEEQE